MSARRRSERRPRRHASSSASGNDVGIGPLSASSGGGGASAAAARAANQPLTISGVITAGLSVSEEISLISNVVQYSASHVLGGSHALSLHGCLNDGTGTKIPVSAKLDVTRRSSTDEVEFKGCISIGGGRSFALSATSDKTSFVGPSDSIALTVGEEIFLDARDGEEEEEIFQECQVSLGSGDWTDHCQHVVATTLRQSNAKPSVIKEWSDKAKSCRDDEMGEEKVLSSAYDLLVRTSSSEVALETILGLVALHPAPHVVIFWLRWARLLMAYHKWRASGRDVLLFPIRVQGKGQDGWDTKDWSSYRDVLRLIKRIGSQGKIPVLLMNCITRLCRNPLHGAQMLGEIRSCGGEVVTLRQWNRDFTRLPLIVLAQIKMMTMQGSVRADGSTFANPLPRERGGKIKSIGQAGSELILQNGTTENKYAVEATLAGVDAAKKYSSLLDKVYAVLTPERLQSLQGGTASIDDIRGRVDSVSGELVGIRHKSDGRSPSTILQFTRISRAGNRGTDNRATLRVNCPTNNEDLCIAAEQCAINIYAIEQDVGKKNIDNFDHVILPVSNNRRTDLIPEFFLMIAMILSGNVYMVVMTVTTRASAHLGYVLLLIKVCEATNTKLVFSHYIHSENITGEQLAIAEQERYDAEHSAFEVCSDECETICDGDPLFPDMCKLADTQIGQIGKGKMQGEMLRELTSEVLPTETDDGAKKPPASARGAKASGPCRSQKRKSVAPAVSAAIPPRERRSSLRTRQVVPNYAKNDDKAEAME